MLKKRLTALLLSVVTLCGAVSASAVPDTAASGQTSAQTTETQTADAAQQQNTGPVALNSQAAVVMDADTGDILYSLNPDNEYPMASITKTMTALITLEEGDLTASTTATAAALDLVDLNSTRIGFVEGENLTIDELMYCMLVYSANDAANILAAAVAGDVPTFVEKMNKKAEELGCTHTHFANPNGLDEDGHYSSAHDMALIMRAANQYPEFAKYSGTTSYELPGDNMIPQGWWIKTKVDMYDQADPNYDSRIYAAKTGYTTKAHNTFVAASKSDKANLIIALLCCPVKKGIFADTKALVDYCEKTYSQLTLQPEDFIVAAKSAADEQGYTVDLHAQQACTVFVPNGTKASDLEYTSASDAEGKPCLNVSFQSGKRSILSTASNTDGSQTVGQVALVAEADSKTQEVTGSADNAPASSGNLLRTVKSVVSGNIIVRTLVIIAVAAILFFILLLIRRSNIIRRKKRKAKKK